MPKTVQTRIGRPDTSNKLIDLSIQFAGGVSIAPLRTPDLKRLVGASTRAVTHPWALTLRFVARREARAINQAYRQAEYAPNVLTFEYPQARCADILICPPVVREQAAEQRKTYADHLAHIVVHGVLHALGHTHHKPRQASRMEGLERQILARFDIGDPYA